MAMSFHLRPVCVVFWTADTVALPPVEPVNISVRKSKTGPKASACFGLENKTAGSIIAIIIKAEMVFWVVLFFAIIILIIILQFLVYCIGKFQSGCLQCFGIFVILADRAEG